MTHRMMILVVGLSLPGWVAVQAPAQEVGGAARPVAAAIAGRTDWQAVGNQGAVSAGGLESVKAGLEILKRGGNAADAAAATILALSVTDSRAFCFGGEVPILVYDASTQRLTAIAGQGAAPRLATLEHFKARGGIPASGIEAAAVPAALDACLTLLDRFGTMSFAQVVAPTRRLLARPSRRETWHADFARTLDTLVATEVLAYADGSSQRPVSDPGACDGSPTPSTVGPSPVALTLGRGPMAGFSATRTWRLTPPGSRSRSRSIIAA